MHHFVGGKAMGLGWSCGALKQGRREEASMVRERRGRGKCS